MLSVKTLVFVWSLLRLKSEPSKLYLMTMPMSVFLKGSVSINENMRLGMVQMSLYCLGF